MLALQEAEDARKEKHRKLEEEREKMRGGIRDKVNLERQLIAADYVAQYR